jgi:hypothetical protein
MLRISAVRAERQPSTSMKLRQARMADPAFVMVVVDAGTQARNLREMCRMFVETGKYPGYCGRAEHARLTLSKPQEEGPKTLCIEL